MLDGSVHCAAGSKVHRSVAKKTEGETAVERTWQLAGLCGIALAVLALSPLARALFAPCVLSNPDGCDGRAYWNTLHGEWRMSCSHGHSCGTGNTDPCTEQQGGIPGQVFKYCGCEGSPPPICRYATVEGGSPMPNGFCAGETEVSGNCGPPPCELVPYEPLTEVYVGRCNG